MPRYRNHSRVLPLSLALALAACGPSPRDRGSNDQQAQLPDPAQCGIEIASDGILDLDLPTVHIQGHVTLDGAPLPGSDVAPVLRLQLADSAEGGLFVDLAQVRADGGDYAVDVVPGDYRLLYDYTTCSDPAYPCQQRTVLRQSVNLMADGVYDLDIATVQVTGRLTLDSQPLPPADYTRGTLTVRADDGAPGVFVDLDQTNQGVYTTRLLPGTYDLLYYQPSPWVCTGKPYPCQQGVSLRQSVTFAASGAYDLDLATVRLAGDVTRNGAAMPSSDYSRGHFQLQGADGSTGTLLDLDQGKDHYDVYVFPGTYNIVYVQSDSTCTGSPYPCEQRVLEGCVAPGVQPAE